MKKNKVYLGIWSTLLMAVLLAIPAMAAEPAGAGAADNIAEAADPVGEETDPDEANSDYNRLRQDSGTGDWYYYTDGQIDTSVTEVIKGTVDGVSGWWNVVNGKVTRAETVAKNANGWWYIDENGMVDFNANTVAKNEYGWWYILDGKVQFGFTGLANYKNEYGWWYIQDGRVDFSHNGVDKNVNGWWYMTDGTVQFGFTGLANYRNENGWWYIRDGEVDFSHNGVDKNVNGWFYVTGGKVDFSYNGLASNCYGVWYLDGGKVNFSFNDTYTIGNTTYTFEGGQVVLASHRAGESLTQIDLDILTMKKGTVLSRTLTQSEFNQIVDKFMNSSYVKDIAYKSTSGGFVWNGGTRWDCSSTTLYLMNDYLLTYDEAYQAAKEENASAGTASLISSALASVGDAADGAFPETGSAAPTNSVSQAMSWGNPVYTYETVDQLYSGGPGSLRYGDLLYYGTINGSTVKISHVAVYLGQYYLANGDRGYYQLENDNVVQGVTKEGRSDGVRISPLRTADLVHVARIF